MADNVTTDAEQNKDADAEETNATDVENANIEMLLDIPLSVHVRLGETRMALREVLKLGPGSVLRLNRSESDGVEVLVNGKLVATGQIIQTPEGHVGVEVSTIVARAERLRSLK